jgi:putative methionine-R-sulfoxide reductase with GAF domain
MVRTTNTPKTTNTVKNVDKFSDANGFNPDLNSFIVCVFLKMDTNYGILNKRGDLLPIIFI